VNETQGGVRRDTILDRYSIEPLSSLFCTPAEETALLIKLRRKVISQLMCRSRPSLPRAALLSLSYRRRITLHKLLFSASSARTVLFLLFSCSSSVVLRRTQPQGGTTGTARPDRAHQRVRRDPLRRGGPLKGGRRLFKAPPRQLHVADNGGLLTAPNPCTPLERGRKRLAQPTVIQKA